MVSFSGTVDTSGDTVFGENGPAIPVSVSLTFDTSLGGPVDFIPSGSGSPPFAQQYVGYDRANIIASNITFGTKTWEIADISDRIAQAGHSASIWFNDFLESSNPSAVWIYFFHSDGTFQIGESLNTGSIDFQDGFSIQDSMTGKQAGSIQFTMTVQTVSDASPVADNSLLKAALRKKIKKLKKAIKRARGGDITKIRRLKKKLRKTKAQLKRL